MKLKLSLQQKILIQNIVLMLSLLIILAGLTLSLISTSLVDKRKESATFSINSLQVQLEAKISNQKNIIRLLATHDEFLKFALFPENKELVEPVNDLLRTVYKDVQVDNVYLMTADGRVIASIDQTFVDKNFMFRKYFREAIQGKLSNEVALGTVTNKMGMYFSAPIMNDSTPVGVVAMKLNVDNFFGTIGQEWSTKNGYYFLTDEYGVVMVSNKQIPQFSSLGKLSINEVKNIESERLYEGVKINPLQYDGVMDLIRNYSTSSNKLELMDEEDGDSELINIKKIGNYPYFVVLENSLDSAFIDEWNIFKPMMFLWPLLLVAGSIILYWLSYKLVLPITKLEKQAKDALTNQSISFDDFNTGDEIQSLAASIKNLVLTLKENNLSLEKTISQKTGEMEVNLKMMKTRNIEKDNTELAMLNLLEDANHLEKQLEQEKKNVENKVVERTKELTETMTRFQHAIDSVPRVFVVVDMKLDVLIHNNKMEKVFDIQEDEWTLEKIDDLLGSKVEIVNKVHDVVNTKEVINFRDVEYKNKILSIYISPIINKDGVIGAVLTIDDITERVMLERSKDEFFSIASHELRTPLTAIRGNTSMIQDYFKEQIKDPELGSMISDIHDSSVRLIDIVNDFLNISRLEQGKMDYKIESADINEVILDVLKEYSGTKLTKGLKLKFEQRSNDQMLAMADVGKVKQILTNLIGNSLKFTTKGSITVSIEQLPGKVKVLVEDTGRGIPEKQQGLLFRKFQQTGENLYTRDTAGGTGLGLYISKKMIMGMGGDIRLEKSGEGQGSTFSFELPSIDKK